MRSLILRSLLGLFVVFSTSVQASAADGSIAMDRCNKNTWKNVNQISGEVEKVVDGDTIHILTRGKKYSIRFLSIDTPETNYMGKSQGYWGERAKVRLAELLPLGTQVDVLFDEESCDKYGRVLGHVFKGRTHINRVMVKEGLAVNYCIFPNYQYCRDLGNLTDRNIREHRGMYGDPNAEIPYEWRRVQSGRPFEKFIGNIDTKAVYHPGAYDQVSTGDRIFFFEEADIEPPFFIAD